MVEYDLFATGLVLSHKHYSQITARSQISKIASFTEYLVNRHLIKKSDGAGPSSGDGNRGKGAGDVTAPATTQVVGKDAHEAPEEELIEGPLVRLTRQMRKAAVANDSEGQDPPVTTSGDASTTPTVVAPQLLRLKKRQLLSLENQIP